MQKLDTKKKKLNAKFELLTQQNYTAANRLKSTKWGLNILYETCKYKGNLPCYLLNVRLLFKGIWNTLIST